MLLGNRDEKIREPVGLKANFLQAGISDVERHETRGFFALQIADKTEHHEPMEPNKLMLEGIRQHSNLGNICDKPQAAAMRCRSAEYRSSAEHCFIVFMEKICGEFERAVTARSAEQN